MGRHRKTNAALDARIVALRQEGHSIHEIGRALRVSPWTVYRRAVEHGVGRLARARGSARKRDDTPIIALRVQGWTMQRIANEVGITRQRVHQILERHNMTTKLYPRGPREQPNDDA